MRQLRTSCNLQFSIYNLQFAIIPFCLIILLAHSRLFSAEIPLAVPAEGQPFGAELIAIDDKEQLTFQAAGQKRQMGLGDLVVWGTCGEPKHTPILVLADGGLLVTDAISTDKETLVAESKFFGQLRLPLNALAGVVYQLPAAIKDCDALFDRIAQAKGETDRLRLDNGDELTGLLEEITEDAVKLKTDMGAVDVEIGPRSGHHFQSGPQKKNAPRATSLLARHKRWQPSTSGQFTHGFGCPAICLLGTDLVN